MINWISVAGIWAWKRGPHWYLKHLLPWWKCFYRYPLIILVSKVLSKCKRDFAIICHSSWGGCCCCWVGIIFFEDDHRNFCSVNCFTISSFWELWVQRFWHLWNAASIFPRKLWGIYFRQNLQHVDLVPLPSPSPSTRTHLYSFNTM